MKKIVIIIPILICVIMFVLLYTVSRDVEKVTYRETMNENLDLESIDYEVEVKIDKELAYKIGKAVLESIKGDSIKGRHFYVNEIREENIYTIWVSLSEGTMIGHCITVAIDGTDGSIIKVWPGE